MTRRLLEATALAATVTLFLLQSLEGWKKYEAERIGMETTFRSETFIDDIASNPTGLFKLTNVADLFLNM